MVAYLEGKPLVQARQVAIATKELMQQEQEEQKPPKKTACCGVCSCCCLP